MRNAVGHKVRSKILKKKRSCLKCGKLFLSLGIWNRLCPGCQKKNEGVVRRERFDRIKYLAVFLCLLCNISFAGEKFTDEQIADAIFQAEGEYRATYLYGIRSVKYKDEAEARRICLNTIKNNRKRYVDYGYKTCKTYLEFLASRYCPLNVQNDPKNLNQYWLRNVRFFLDGYK